MILGLTPAAAEHVTIPKQRIQRKEYFELFSQYYQVEHGGRGKITGWMVRDFEKRCGHRIEWGDPPTSYDYCI